MLTVSLLFSLLPQPAKGYVSALGNVIDVAVSGDTLTLTIDNGAESNDDLLIVEAVDQHILRVNYLPNGIEPSPDTPMLDPGKTWSGGGASIDTAGDPIVITTAEMRIEIARYPCRITIKKADGTTLLWEPLSGGVFHDGVRFVHPPEHNLYGIRSYSAFEDGTDIIRNTSDHPAHAGEQGDAGGPLIWSTAGYGILVDSDGGYPYTEEATGKLEFYYGGTPTEGRRYPKSDVEYFIILGDPHNIMSAVAEITGKPPMLPKWSLGFMNFEWDNDQAEMIDMVDTYRAKNIPLDAYGLDYDWKRYGESDYGEFRWNTDNFPDADSGAWKAAMDAKGVNMIGITKPRIVTRDFGNNRTTQYHDAEAGDYWYPGHYEYQDYFIPVTVRSIDPYRPEVRSWLWNHSIDAFNKGIVGWWNDETDKVSSGGTVLWFGNFTTTHLSQGMYEGQRAYTNQRVWQTARTFYPGAQRYATTLWSGDIGIQFYKGENIHWAAGLQEQRAVMLSSINLGQPKWGMDTGGFNQQDGTTNNPHPELYARWMQFGAVTPVFRVHGNYQQQRQPWFYGMTAEEVSKSAIHLRYSLIPYMYAYERQAYETGIGLVKPLLWDYPEDPNVKNHVDAWMFGDYLLVSPVVEKQQTSKSIYLPAGTWIDYFRGHTYAGGQTIHYPLNAETWTDLPMFIKKGAIIPKQDVQDYIGQRPVTSVHVDVFPDTEQTSFTYYDDDGETYDYETGGYFKQTMTVQDAGSNTTVFTVGAKTGSYQPDLQHYIVAIHGQAAAQVTMNGSSLTPYADLHALQSNPGEGWAKGKDLYGDVTYVKIAAGSLTRKEVVLSGHEPVTQEAVIYEAEEASLSGNTLYTKATVNSNHSGYSGNGFVDGFHHKGAAVTFYVDVKTGGDYPVDLRYANGSGSDQTISIFVNGQWIKQTTLDSLADWDSWAVKTEMLPLVAGRNIITYKHSGETGDTGHVNLDYIAVPFFPATAKVEAESAALSGGAKTNKDHWFYSGVAFVDGFESLGAAAEFQVEVPASGSYQAALRYANGTGETRTLSMYVNGAKVSQIQLTSPGQNWNLWQDHVQTIALQEGVNTIQFKYDSMDTGRVNLDRLLVSSTAVVTPESENNLLDNGNFERDASFSSNWTEWHPAGQPSAFGIDSGSSINPPESPWSQDKRAYFWQASPYKQSIHQEISVPVNDAYYRLEAWVRLMNAAPYVARAEIANHGSTPIFHEIEPGDGWQYIRVDNIHVTSGQLDVGFYVDSPGGTTLLIDDVRLTKQE